MLIQDIGNVWSGVKVTVKPRTRRSLQASFRWYSDEDIKNFPDESVEGIHVVFRQMAEDADMAEAIRVGLLEFINSDDVDRFVRSGTFRPYAEQAACRKAGIE